MAINAVHVRHTGNVVNGVISASSNTAAFSLRASSDGKTWSEFSKVGGNTCNASYVPNQQFETPGLVQAKFLQLSVTQSGLDAATAEEYELEVYGTATSSQCGLTSCGVGTPVQRERAVSVGFLALLSAFGLRRGGSRRRRAS